MECPKCHGTLHEIKMEIRKEIKIIPAQIKIIEHATPVYGCRKCEATGTSGTMIKAPSPKALLPKSFVSPSFMAHLMNQKFSVGLPLYRMEQEFKRQGLTLSRQNMANWILQGAGLLNPLQTYLKKSLLQNEVIMADETTVQVLKEENASPQGKKYMWVYRTDSYALHPVVLFDYCKGRKAQYPATYLQDYRGFLVTDGYKAYNQLKNVTLCRC